MIDPIKFDEYVVKVASHLASGSKVLVEIDTPGFPLRRYNVTGLFINARGRVDEDSILNYSGENDTEQSVALRSENIYGFYLELD